MDYVGILRTLFNKEGHPFGGGRNQIVGLKASGVDLTQRGDVMLF